MDRITAVAILAVIFLALLWLMWRGWKGRQQSQAHIPAPGAPASAPAGEATAGMYVATTLADQPLERVNVHGLGVRTNARVFVTPTGVVMSLDGVGDFEIPAGDIIQVGFASGMIGKFVEKDGLVVIRWQLGDTQVDTGFRPRVAAERTELKNRIAELKES